MRARVDEHVGPLGRELIENAIGWPTRQAITREHFVLHSVSAPLVLGWLDRMHADPTTGSSTTTVRTVLLPMRRMRTGLRMLRLCGRVLRGASLCR